MENLYYLIPFFLILICVMPVFVKIRGSYNVLKNRGAFALYIFGVKVKSYRFMLSHMSIKLYDEEDQKEEDLDFESKEAILVKSLVGQVKEKTKVKLIEVNYNIGVGDAFQTAMLCGVVNSLLLTFFTRIKCSKPTASLMLCDNMAFNKTVFETAVTVKISISLFDLVYSFINSVIISLKGIKP